MKVNTLGVKIDDISLDQAIYIVETWLKKGGKRYIVTPNPEFIVRAQNDQEFMEILNKANLAIPDGVGLKLAGVKNRIAGVDLMEKLCEIASQKGLSVGLLGGKDNVAKLTAQKLAEKYPSLKISFAEDGGEVDEQGDLSSSSGRKKMDILFVAFGPPKQEKWIAKNLKNIPVKVAMGVGGAFDFLSGKIPRAPERIRNLGLEWLFRLTVEPWRIKRQLALVKFVWLVLTKK